MTGCDEFDYDTDVALVFGTGVISFHQYFKE